MPGLNESAHISPYSFQGPEQDELHFLYGFLSDQLKGGKAKHEEAVEVISVAQSISDVYIWILFAIGVPANIMAIATILSMPKITPTSFLVALLAAFDCIALIAKLTGHQIIRNHVYIGTLGCKLQFLVIYIATMANWILVFICAERFLAVCFPAKRSVMFTKRNTYIAVAIVAAALLVFFASITGVMRAADKTGRRCGVYDEYLWFWTHVWYWINATLFLFIPFLCIFPMTVWMVGTRYAASKRNSSASSKKESESGNGTGYGNDSPAAASATDQPIITETAPAPEQRPQSEEEPVTRMLILAAVFFLVLSLPACGYYLAYSPSTGVLVKAGWALYEQIQHLLVDSTHVVNFFLYFISAKIFRDHFISLLLCKKCRETSFEPAQEITSNA